MTLFKTLFLAVVGDRTIQAGTTTSGLAIWGGLHAPNFTAWIATYAVFVGALGSTAVLVYTVLKIVRLLRNPRATE